MLRDEILTRQSRPSTFSLELTTFNWKTQTYDERYDMIYEVSIVVESIIRCTYLGVSSLKEKTFFEAHMKCKA